MTNFFQNSYVIFEVFNVQHCLNTTIESWQRLNDGGGQESAFLTDPSKTFDCVGHELLVAKLFAYDFLK